MNSLQNHSSRWFNWYMLVIVSEIQSHSCSSNKSTTIKLMKEIRIRFGFTWNFLKKRDLHSITLTKGQDTRKLQKQFSRIAPGRIHLICSQRLTRLSIAMPWNILLWLNRKKILVNNLWGEAIPQEHMWRDFALLIEHKQLLAMTDSRNDIPAYSRNRSQRWGNHFDSI